MGSGGILLMAWILETLRFRALMTWRSTSSGSRWQDWTCVESVATSNTKWSQMSGSILSPSITPTCSLMNASFVRKLSTPRWVWQSTSQSVRKPTSRIIIICTNLSIVLEPLLSPDDLFKFVERDEVGPFCGICRIFRHKSNSNVRNHVESKHFPFRFVYTCEICGKQVKTKASLSTHKSEQHRNSSKTA